MIDQIVTFKTALILKELGFNEECRSIFNENREIEHLKYFEGDGSGVTRNLELEKDYFGTSIILVTAPTQSLVARWLRELVKIDITIQGWRNKENESVYSKIIFTDLIDKETENYEYYNTYEEALEFAIQEALEVIKAKKT